MQIFMFSLSRSRAGLLGLDVFGQFGPDQVPIVRAQSAPADARGTFDGRAFLPRRSFISVGHLTDIANGRALLMQAAVGCNRVVLLQPFNKRFDPSFHASIITRG